MVQLATLINLTHQFITERNWWQFHNPKNDAYNVLIEASELAELLIQPELTAAQHQACAEELADVLSAIFSFSVVSQLNLVAQLEQQLNTRSNASYSQLSYTELKTLVVNQSALLGLAQLATPTQVGLSLIFQAGRLADLFNWQNAASSVARAQAQMTVLSHRTVQIVVHLVWLAYLLKIDLSVEFQQKMAKNFRKFPVAQAQGDNWLAIKDGLRQ